MLVAQKRKTNGKRRRKNRRIKSCVPRGSKITPSAYFRWKEFVERALAALLLVPGLPLIALLAVLVRLHTRGPGIFRQVRMGRNAQVFTMYKIRTMCADAEAAHGPVWAKHNDPRVTRLGRFLRKVHLDELPQLINVLKGEMSLIGPRPERPEIVAVLAKMIPGYTDRLVVLPGITGLAQINLPPDSTHDDVRRKLCLDVEYIQQAGPWLDARIFMSTFIRLLGLPGVIAMYLLCLHRQVPTLDGAAPGGTNNANRSSNGKAGRVKNEPDDSSNAVTAMACASTAAPNKPR